MSQEPSPEFAGQVLNDILRDLTHLHEIVMRLLTANTSTGLTDWRDMEALRYVERQLDTKIRYLRSERY